MFRKISVYTKLAQISLECAVLLNRVLKWLFRFNYECFKRFLKLPLQILFSFVRIQSVSNFLDGWKRFSSFSVIKARHISILDHLLRSCDLIPPFIRNWSRLLAAGDESSLRCKFLGRPYVLIDLVKACWLLIEVVGSDPELCWLNSVWDKLTKSFQRTYTLGSCATHVTFQADLILFLAFSRINWMNNRLTIGHIKCARVTNCQTHWVLKQSRSLSK